MFSIENLLDHRGRSKPNPWAQEFPVPSRRAGERGGRSSLTSSCLRGSSCSCLSFATLCALSASAFRLPPVLLLFLLREVFEVSSDVACFAVHCRRKQRFKCDVRTQLPSPRTTAPCQRDLSRGNPSVPPAMEGRCPPAATSARPPMNWPPCLLPIAHFRQDQ